MLTNIEFIPTLSNIISIPYICVNFSIKFDQASIPMTTFLLSIPESIRQFSETLNIKSILCMQAWHVLNDQNVKILYIFRKDGSLLISANGDVEKARWEYIKENQTILIEQSTQCLLFHPIFYDDVVLAIQQDGTDRFLAMVNGDKVDKFLELTVESINKHFLYAAHPEIRDAEKREAREKREREELERKRILEERRHEIE